MDPETRSVRAIAILREADFNIAYSRALIERSAEHDRDVRRAATMLAVELEYRAWMEAQADFGDHLAVLDDTRLAADEARREVDEHAVQRDRRFWEKVSGETGGA